MKAPSAEPSQYCNAAGTHGIATGVGTGTCTITAAYAGVSGSANLTVVSLALVSIVVTPASASIGIGATQQFMATGYYPATTQDLTALATWSSSDIGVATISNAAGMSGLATGSASGSATIPAMFRNVIGSASLDVTQ